MVFNVERLPRSGSADVFKIKRPGQEYWLLLNRTRFPSHSNSSGMSLSRGFSNPSFGDSFGAVSRDAVASSLRKREIGFRSISRRACACKIRRSTRALRFAVPLTFSGCSPTTTVNPVWPVSNAFFDGYRQLDSVNACLFHRGRERRLLV